jgi:hypothetical protein
MTRATAITVRIRPMEVMKASTPTVTMSFTETKCAVVTKITAVVTVAADTAANPGAHRFNPQQKWALRKEGPFFFDPSS